MDELKTNEEFADKNPEKFEQMILHVLELYPDKFLKYGSKICRSSDNSEWRDSFQVPAHNAILRAIYKFHDMMKGKEVSYPIQNQMLKLLLQMQIDEGSPHMDAADLADFDDYIAEVRGIDTETASNMFDLGIVRWIKKRVAAVSIAKLQARVDWDPDSLVNQLLIDTGDIGGEDQQTSYYFGHGIDQKRVIEPRIPVTSLPRLSQMMGGAQNGGVGGFLAGEHTLFVAPTGAGKTVMACQLGLGLAMQNLNVVLVTTEQPYYELEPRIISSYCSIPFDSIKDGLDPGRLSTEYFKKYRELRALMTNRLWFEDWSQNKSLNVIQNLSQVLRTYRNKHGRVDVLILDWLGGAIGANVEVEKLRHTLQQTADHMTTLAQQERIITISFAQANITQSMNKRLVNSGMIADNKSLGRNAANIFGISALRENAAVDMQDETPTYAIEQCLNGEKIRKGKAGSTRLIRRFGFQRFEQ